MPSPKTSPVADGAPHVTACDDPARKQTPTHRTRPTPVLADLAIDNPAPDTTSTRPDGTFGSRRHFALQRTDDRSTFGCTLDV